MFVIDPDPQAVLQELSGELMSPYCPGRTIAGCPSSNARKLEDEILDAAQKGKTREEIEADLVSRFGEDIIGYKPPPYLLGGTVVLGTIALVGLFVVGRRWVRGTEPSVPANPETPRAQAPQGGTPPTRAELDALDDALDDEEGF